ncbi:MAG TPA: L-histidine N(alpha)-methyltransferase [Candidatus Nanoarchaeia archaeon]|nr:L-histidine N(alpha)-methyltransferase [Candidatus Nanoarchaeia archaeon]
MKINDLIFREISKRGYALEKGIRIWNIADSKLCYLTPKQAQGFLDLSKTIDYKKGVIDKEISLIKKYMGDCIKELPKNSCNVVDLGCGDGQKASLFIHQLASRMKIRYCPVDISSYMVEKAAKTIRAMNVGEVLEFKWNISDFENLNNITPLFRDAGFENHFMLLLGNTLGNFDREDVLHGIRESMGKMDLLLIGNGLVNGQKDWIKAYKSPAINKWLIQIPLQLGLLKKEVEYEVRFVNSRIEEVYRIKKARTIRHLGKTLSFKKGDIIVVVISYKYTKAEFKRMLEKFFNNVELYTDNEGSYALALCKR